MVVAPAVAVVTTFTVKEMVEVVTAVVLLTSLTLKVTLAVVYVVVGVPDTSPVLGSIVIPAGSVPALTKYVYGVYPPVTLLNGLKLVMAIFCVALTVVVAPVVAVRAAFTVKETVEVVVATTLLASLTLNVTLAVVYIAVGVPDTRPVLLLIVIPAGNVPALTKYVYGVVPPVTLLNGLKLVIAEF